MNVFSPLDSWIAAAGRTDEWLSLGLDLLDRWQATDAEGGGQAHLVAVLAAVQAVRPTPVEPPDPVVLAVWFHHAAVPPVAESGQSALELSASTAYDRLAALGEPALAGEVARLVRQLGVRHPERDDPDGALLLAAHRAAGSRAHLAAVPPVVGDQ